MNGVKHGINMRLQRFNTVAQALFFGLWVLGHKVCDNDAWFMQPYVALGSTLLGGCATEHNRLLVQRLKPRFFAHKGTQFCHFRNDHGDNF